jgi:OPA family glycerol-3-phosphate transporter-like MFS transporter
VETFMPTYIEKQYNLGSSVSILTGVAMPVFALISQQVAGILFNKVFKDAFRSAFFIFVVGTVAAGMLYLVYLFRGNVVLAVFLLALLTGCMHGVNMNLICILPPILAGNSKVSSVSGLLNSFTYVGSAISMCLIPLSARGDDWSLTIAMWIGFALLGTGMNLLCLPIWKKYNTKQTV